MMRTMSTILFSEGYVPKFVDIVDIKDVKVLFTNTTD
jgi:hypothetical protein